MFEKYLEDLGLSEKEAKVYLSLLEVDNDSVLDLADKTKINRTTIYPVLESLSKKGLISEVKVDKKVRFQAEPPERLETYVERQRIGLEEHSKRLKDVIPQLKSIYKEDSEKPIAKFFEGKDGVISMTEELLTSKEKDDGVMYMIYNKDMLEKLFTDADTKRFRELRVKKNVKGKSIYTYTKGELDRAENLGNRLRIDENKFPISCDITIFGNMVRVATLKSSVGGIMIYNKDFADTMKSLFELAFGKIE